MVKNIFRFTMVMILATAGLVAITPVLSVNDLLYPIRIDSAFVQQQRYIYDKGISEGKQVPNKSFLYSPSQLKINYIDLELPVADSTRLRGWLAIDTTRMQSPLIFIIPDISEGAVTYIPALKQFCDRGFNVCVMNMRGQGNSDGLYYTPGDQAASDVAYLVSEIRKMPFIDRVILFGNRTGAAIAMKSVADSAYADVMVLQNPFRSLRYYFRHHALDKWGSIVEPFMPAVRRSYENKIGIDLDDYNYLHIISKINIPHMLVTANYPSQKYFDETVLVYNASNHINKKLFVDTRSYLQGADIENDKSYYDRISAYINGALPARQKKSRFRKLAGL